MPSHHLTTDTLLALDTIFIYFYDFIIGPTYLLLPSKVPHTRDVKANVIKHFEAFKDTMMVFIAIVSNNIKAYWAARWTVQLWIVNKKESQTGTNMHMHWTEA